jgi:2-polyprenyl-3-methyl-5-hydroxy-6-metoxy-1,4-benzoquinol methylase
MSYHDAAHVYDLLYSFKDYGAEAQILADLIRERAPASHSVLDAACGTGEHARHLASGHGFAVDGIDLEPRFGEMWSSACSAPSDTLEHSTDWRPPVPASSNTWCPAVWW